MPIVPFHAIADHARVWVFGAVQPLLGNEAETLVQRVDSFVRGWQAHGMPVVGAFDWCYDRFLLIAADEQATGVSGCSIDALFQVLKSCESDLGVNLLDASIVFYRDSADTIRAATRHEFRELVAAGEVGASTPVFDNTVGLVRAIRGGEWERPMRESWHARAFAPRATAAPAIPPGS